MKYLLLGLLLYSPKVTLSADHSKCALLLNANPSNELSPKERQALLSKMSFKSKPYEWRQEKTGGRGKGSYQLIFKEAEEIVQLPPALKALEGTLDIRRVSPKNIPLYHETSFGTLDDLIISPDPSNEMTGLLNWQELRFSNVRTEPAFYTHLDPKSGIMLSRNPEALIKIEVTKDSPVILIALRQPSNDELKESMIHSLSGDPNFYKNFYAQHKSHVGDEFDLFHSAVIHLLREKYGIPTDIMLFQNAFHIELPRPADYQYLWFVVYNRDLLENAVVPKVFSYKSLTFSDGINVNDAPWATVSRNFVEFARKNPTFVIEFNNQLRSELNSLPYSTDLSQIFGKDVIVSQAMQREWYDGKILEQFYASLYNANHSELKTFFGDAENFDLSVARKHLLQRAIEYWKIKSTFLNSQ